MLRGLPPICLFFGLLLPLTACGTDPAGQCQIAADCASGSCGADGQCNTDSPLDAGADADPSDFDAALSACGSVVDGIITHDELPLAPGKMANFRIATGADFDTAGTEIAGSLTWDLDRPLANDVDTAVLLSATTSAWYAASFPGASYASQLNQSSDLLGVFRLEAGGLFLLGVVSPEGGFTRTELSYSPPVLLMPLPLTEGDTWNTEATVSGLASGVVSGYTESYTGFADKSGTLVSPYGAFRVLRSRMELTRTIGLLVTTTRQYSFVAECAGIVASIVSQDNEQDLDFQSAAEIRRLIP